MGKNAATHLPSARPPVEEPVSSRPSFAPVIKINVRHVGRKPQPRTLIGATAPEGWIKKIDRPREGKVWIGYFHLYVADSFGRPLRKEKEKTLGPATMPKHEAQQKLADYIEEFTGKLIHQGRRCAGKYPRSWREGSVPPGRQVTGRQRRPFLNNSWPEAITPEQILAPSFPPILR